MYIFLNHIILRLHIYCINIKSLPLKKKNITRLNFFLLIFLISSTYQNVLENCNFDLKLNDGRFYAKYSCIEEYYMNNEIRTCNVKSIEMDIETGLKF